MLNFTQSLGDCFSLGGEIFIEPINEKKRYFKCNRTQYTILPSDKYSFDAVNCHLYLPAFLGENFHLKMTSFKNGELYSYRLQSLIPDRGFVLNGNAVFDVILKKFDQVLIGTNALKMIADTKQTLDESPSDSSDEFESKLRVSAKSKMPIYIEGPTGTGKTSLAKRIHQLSACSGPFIHLNLSSFAENLIESELFGHVKGAFTGAHADKIGAMREAMYGTLFLDEIDSIHPAIQAKLLLAIEDLKIRPVGGHKEFPLDLRLIFSSGKNLKQSVKEGRVREDFYFRLMSGVPFYLNAIAENKAKLIQIIKHELNKESVTVEGELLQLMQEHSWPGNYRELLSYIKRKKILAKTSVLTLDKSDHDYFFNGSDFSLREQANHILTLSEIEKRYCFEVYLKCQKNLKLASSLLKISSSTLRQKIAA